MKRPSRPDQPVAIENCVKILGIDPAISCLGWGIIESNARKITYINSGLIKTKSSRSIHSRLADIARSISEIIDLYKPTIIAMEETFINTNAKSSLKLAYARGAIMSVIGSTTIPFYEYAPNHIKKTIIGVGHGEKEQVLHMVKIIISGITDDLSYDQADALGVAYTCLVAQSKLI